MGGGGHSGTRWIPTAKQPRRAEAVNQSYVKLQGVYPHPQEDIRAFSVVVLTSEPGSGAHYCSIPNGPFTLTDLEYDPSCNVD